MGDGSEGEMNLDDRGGSHDHTYLDEGRVAASFGLTPSQTIGPFFAYGLTPGAYGYPLDDIHAARLVPAGSSEMEITIAGRIFDGDGNPIHDAMVEIIQADAAGQYSNRARNDGFSGYGRCGTGADRTKPGYQFTTIKPESAGICCAPSITMIITMRGLLNHCITRMYFPEDNHDDDIVLKQIPKGRQHTLLAEPDGKNHYHFDIHMQGENETVFFDL